jgi:hypothetical protein
MIMKIKKMGRMLPEGVGDFNKRAKVYFNRKPKKFFIKDEY